MLNFGEMVQIPNECKILIKRLKECDIDEISSNPSIVIGFYPIRNPENEATIFDEVYCILNDNLLTKSYKFRVFYFLNIMLSSVKTPAYVIATYIKQLSRMSLTAKPRTLVALLALVGNLFIRHPLLISLRDQVDVKAREMEIKSSNCTLRSWLEQDPFDPRMTQDLRQSNAMDSCIWELMPLRFHRHPKVAAASSFLSQTEMPDMEFELTIH